MRVFALGFTFVDEPVHVFVSCFVCLVDLVIQQLGVVDAKPTVLSTNPHDFVDHVKAITRHLRTVVLLAYHINRVLVLCRFQIDEGFGLRLPLGFSLFHCLFFLDIIVHF